ncbi:MAG: serine/threonine protein kinase [Myxococcota bacterium]|jgi:serine/threonine-protein kinase|nr:serine/threonine protein kinase [Myxococcota bacterium]
MAMSDVPPEPVRDATARTPAVLERVGRYNLIYILGKGGMATVYMGQASGLAGFEKLVTVKVIHPHLAQERSFVNMFLDEARLSALIQHPNVAAVQEVGEQDGLLYMVGEFVEGQSLKTVIDKATQCSTRLSHPMAAYIASCVCDGLHAAHELADEDGRHLNLVHRDVSPPNMMISYQGFVKLIDFGVAQSRGRASHTDVGTIKGKMGYMAPEQLKGRSLDRRIDIFALGVTLYEVITGRHPFPGATGLERLNRIASGEYWPPRAVEPSVDPELERIIVKAMAHRREDRFANAAEMADALRQYLDSTGIAMGIEQVIDAMKWLFPEEIASHRATVKEFREQNVVLDLSGLEKVNTHIASALRGPRRSKRVKRIYALASASLVLLVAGGGIAFCALSQPAAPNEPDKQVIDDVKVIESRPAVPKK